MIFLRQGVFKRIKFYGASKMKIPNLLTKIKYYFNLTIFACRSSFGICETAADEKCQQQ
jgi:hypothetical protein